MTMYYRLWPYPVIYNAIIHTEQHPDSKFHGANMGPIWGRQDPGGPHVGPMDYAVWAVTMVQLQQGFAFKNNTPWLTREG